MCDTPINTCLNLLKYEILNAESPCLLKLIKIALKERLMKNMRNFIH